jgi:hypothetical protein
MEEDIAVAMDDEVELGFVQVQPFPQKVTRSGTCSAMFGMFCLIGMVTGCLLIWNILQWNELYVLGLLGLLVVVVFFQTNVGGFSETSLCRILLDRKPCQITIKEESDYQYSITSDQVQSWMEIPGNPKLCLQTASILVILEVEHQQTIQEIKERLVLKPENQRGITWYQPRTISSIFKYLLGFYPAAWLVVGTLVLMPILGLVVLTKYKETLSLFSYAFCFAMCLASMIFVGMVSIKLVVKAWKNNWTSKPWLVLKPLHFRSGNSKRTVRYQDVTKITKQKDGWQVMYGRNVPQSLFLPLDSYSIAGMNSVWQAMLVLEEMVERVKDSNPDIVYFLPEIERILEDMQEKDPQKWVDDLQRAFAIVYKTSNYRERSGGEELFWHVLQNPNALPHERAMAAYCLVKKKPEDAGLVRAAYRAIGGLQERYTQSMVLSQALMNTEQEPIRSLPLDS